MNSAEGKGMPCVRVRVKLCDGDGHVLIQGQCRDECSHIILVVSAPDPVCREAARLPPQGDEGTSALQFVGLLRLGDAQSLKLRLLSVGQAGDSVNQKVWQGQYLTCSRAASMISSTDVSHRSSRFPA